MQGRLDKGRTKIVARSHLFASSRILFRSFFLYSYFKFISSTVPIAKKLVFLLEFPTGEDGGYDSNHFGFYADLFMPYHSQGLSAVNDLGPFWGQIVSIIISRVDEGLS